MVNEVEGRYDGSGFSAAVMLAEYNDFVTEQLKDGALKTLRRAGLKDEDLDLYRVPGGFELPGAARRVHERKDHDGLLCLGAIIRGETAHFDHLSATVTDMLGRLSYEVDVPVINGVLTTDTVEQAINRAGVKQGNKGREAALSLLQMMNLYDNL